MKIYFIRHGQTENNKKGIMIGHNYMSLTDEGMEETRKASLEILLHFSEIYSSDLIRCQQTADILNQKLNISITYDARLRGRDFGSFADKTWEEIGQDMKEKDKNQQYDYRPYGGESFEDVKKRVTSFIDDIKNTKGDKKILVITSAGVIRLLNFMLNGEIYDKVHNSSIYEFEFED